jgi:aerobic-type carbon monoxide dehydrogenase small subunit (CoxS/CutS family)
MEENDLFFCRYCDKDLLNERIIFVAEDQNTTEEEAREIIDDEIGLCRDCQKEEDSDY